MIHVVRVFLKYPLCISSIHLIWISLLTMNSLRYLKIHQTRKETHHYSGDSNLYDSLSHSLRCRRCVLPLLGVMTSRVCFSRMRAFPISCFFSTSLVPLTFPTLCSDSAVDPEMFPPMKGQEKKCPFFSFRFRNNEPFLTLKLLSLTVSVKIPRIHTVGFVLKAHDC